MQIDIITLFPEIALAPLSESIIKRAREAGIAEVRAHQLRDWATGKHRKTDEYLCGGGQGMLLKPEPIFAAVEELKQVLMLDPRYGDAHFNLAILYIEAPQPQILQAREHYQQAQQNGSQPTPEMDRLLVT